MVENLPQAMDAILMRGIGAEIAVDQDSAQAGVACALQIVVRAVADMERLVWRQAESCEGDVKNLGLRLGVADRAGDKYVREARADVEPIEYSHQTGIEVGNYRENQAALFECGNRFDRFRIESPSLGLGEVGEQFVEKFVETGELAPGFEDLRHQPIPPLPLERLDLSRGGAREGERRRAVEANSKALEQFGGGHRLAVIGRDRGIAFANPARRLDEGACGIEEYRFGSGIGGVL